MIRLWSRDDRQADAPLIYFAHIGKTAGTSFRHAAIRRFGKRGVVSVYTPSHSGGTRKPTEIFFEAYRKGAPERENEPAARAVLDWCEARGARMLCTHHNGVFRHFVPPARIVSFLREPVARLVSNYNFSVDRGWLDPETGFETFALQPRNRNLQRRSLPVGAEEEIGLLAISELYDQSLLAFEEVFGVSLPPLHKNKTRKTARAVTVSSLPGPVLERVRDFNALDIELYDRARARFEKRWAA